MKREEKVAFEEDMFIASEIPLIIDTYDDIFSDFDPRPYHTRALSDDFLYEARKATRDKKPEAILIKFLVPERIRSVANEILIRKRLKEHFRKHYLLLLEEHGRIKKRAISLIFIGMSMIVIASYMFTVGTNSFLLHLLRILLEPGGWFLGWTGLDQLFYTVEEHKKDLQFYEKMSRSKIMFISS